MYRLGISRTAHKQILKFPAREGYRIRVGDFRILYQVDDVAETVTVFRVMTRGDVYKE